jgi:hypothetical protein
MIAFGNAEFPSLSLATTKRHAGAPLASRNSASWAAPVMILAWCDPPTASRSFIFFAVRVVSERQRDER